MTHEEFYNRIQSEELLDYRIEETPGFCHSGIARRDVLDAMNSGRIALFSCHLKVGHKK